MIENRNINKIIVDASFREGIGQRHKDKTKFFYRKQLEENGIFNNIDKIEKLKENQIFFSRYISELVEKTIIELNVYKNWRFLSLEEHGFKQMLFFFKKFFFILSSKYFKQLGCSKNKNGFYHNFYKTQMEELNYIKINTNIFETDVRSKQKFYIHISFLKNFDNEKVFHDFSISLNCDVYCGMNDPDVDGRVVNLFFEKTSMQAFVGIHNVDLFSKYLRRYSCKDRGQYKFDATYFETKELKFSGNDAYALHIRNIQIAKEVDTV